MVTVFDSESDRRPFNGESGVRVLGCQVHYVL